MATASEIARELQKIGTRMNRTERRFANGNITEDTYNRSMGFLEDQAIQKSSEFSRATGVNENRVFNNVGSQDSSGFMSMARETSTNSRVSTGAY